MIIKIKDFLNESIKDKMIPKSKEELDKVWGKLSKKLVSGVIAWHDDIDNEKDALDYIEQYKDVIIDLRKEGWDENTLAHEIVFKEFITEKIKTRLELKEEQQKKDEKRYLSESERERLTDSQRKYLVNKRKELGTWNDDDLLEKFKIGSYEEFMKNKGTANNEFGADVGDKEIEGKVTNLIKMAYDGNYPIKTFKMQDLYKISGWKDTEEDKKYWTAYDDKTKKMIPYYDLSKKQQEKVTKEVNDDIENSDIDYPIIVTVDKDDNPIAVLDGNHRVEKAHRLKRKTLKGIAIPEKDILKKFKKKDTNLKESLRDKMKPKSKDEILSILTSKDNNLIYEHDFDNTDFRDGIKKIMQLINSDWGEINMTNSDYDSDYSEIYDYLEEYVKGDECDYETIGGTDYKVYKDKQVVFSSSDDPFDPTAIFYDINLGRKNK